MATDSTHPLTGDTSVQSESDMAASGAEFGSVQLAAAADAPIPVDVPRGQQIAVIPVRPGQTIELPTDSASGLLAKLGADGNLAIVVDGRTIILQGYAEANADSPIKIVTSDGDVVDITDIILATNPDVALDIQTAAGPAAAGAQAGTDGDATGSGIFVPFAVGPLLGGLNAVGVLDPTLLQYKVIDDERVIYDVEVGNNLPQDIVIVPDDGQPVAEDGAFLLDEDFLKDGNKDLPSPSPQDDDGSAAASGTVVVDFGLDGPRPVDPILMDPIVGGNGAPSGLLTTNGTPILLHLDAPAGGQQVLHGYLTNPGVDDAFILVLDTTTGHFEIFLNASLFHGENSLEDNVTLDVGFTAFDLNDDPQSATLHINFDDDMPEITAGEGQFKLALDETVATEGTGDFDDPNFAGLPLDGTREEDDEHLETLPASLTGIGTVIGAATADASVLFNVDFGADNEALKDAEAYSLTILDADTGLFDTATGQAITLVNAGGGVIEGQIAGGVEVFALTVDPVTGEVSMAQYRAIDHGDAEGEGGAHDEVLFLGSGKLAVTLTAEDGDGDQASKSVDIGSSISFEDDGPVFTSVDFGDNQDSDGKLFGLIDEDALPDGIGDAAPGDGPGGTVVDGVINFDFGSDVPGTLSIDNLKVTDSAGVEIALGDLQTANGRDITINKSVDPVTGIITWAAVVAAGETGAGAPVFTFTLDGAGTGIGDFKFELHQALEHYYTDPDLQNDGKETTYEDDLRFDFTIIGTDGDGDEATGHININVDDDSPTISHLDFAVTLAVDETVATKGTGDVDDPDFNFPQDGTREEDDEHLETLPTVLTNIGAVIGAATDDASKLFSVDFGADGGATTGDAVFDLKIVDTNTGLTDTQTGDPIVLVEENGVILGVADDGDANTDDPVVFALTIDPDTGALSMAQYRAVHHGDQEGEGGAFDEIVSLGAEKLAVTLTVTDADGDSVSAQRDIGNDISFDDDGPSFVNVEFGEDGDSSGAIGVVDEDELPTGNKDSAAGDNSGGTLVDGVISFDFGSDVPGTQKLNLFDFTVTDSAGVAVPLGSLKTVDGQSLIYTQFGPDADGVVVLEARVFGGPDDGDPVFTFKIDTAGANIGAFSFELFRALEHPYTDEDFNNDGKDSNGDPQIAYEDNLIFDFRIFGVDGDGDQAEGHIKIDVDDDSPVVTEASGSFALAVDETLAPNGTGDVDDPNYDGPTLDGTREEDDETLETLPASLTGIGTVIGAATADGSVLFSVDFGADGGAAAGDEVYSLTILDANTGLTDTQTQEPITLHVNGSVIEGRNTTGDVVFALTVDPNTGEVSMAQYRAIDHGDQEGEGGAFDEVLSLGSGKLAVTLTAQDADGDKDSESVDIGSGITFDDDGPTFDETDFAGEEDGDSSEGIGIIDEDALPGGIAGGPGDDAGGLQTDGTIKFDFGSDKAGSLSIAGLTITDSADNTIDLANLKTADGTPVQTKVTEAGGIATYEGYISDGGGGTITVFTLTLDTEGADIGDFEFKLEQPLQHPYTDSDFNNDGNPETGYEDNLLFDFTIIGEDGDGDEATGHIQISVDDDSPDVSPATSGTINLAVDETVGGGADVTGGGTRAENDEELVTLPDALKDIGTVIGAATADASGLFTVNFGADGGAGTGDEFFAFKILDANTGLTDTATGDPVLLVDNNGVIEGRADDGDPNTTDPVVFALTIGQDGTVSMAQYRAINHGAEEAAPGEHDEVAILGGGKLAVTLTVTDADGDQDTETADIGRAITFDDDGPTAPTFTTNTINVVHDETVGIQNGGADDLDGDDVAGTDIAFDGKTVASLFSSLVGGDDPDVGDNPIGYARSDSALVTPTGGSGGSDGIASTSHALKVTDNTFSGVSTTEGTDIFLYQVSPTLIVGRVGTEGAPDTANPVGAIAFAIAIDPETGEVFTAQYLSLNHSDSPDNFDEPVSLIDGAVQVTVTITDKDGDEASASDNVGSQIVFEDDGPTAPTFTANTVDVVHDETAGVQNGGAGDLDGDDVLGSTIAFGATKVEDLFSSLTGGDDPHVAENPIGYARSGSALVTPVGGAAGSDGEASTDYSLKVSSAGAGSGVSTTEGTQIFLYKEGDLIVGRVGTEAGAVDTPNDTGTIAFAIAIDPDTGEVFTVQYLSLNHPTFPDNHDEPVSLTDGAVQVTVTITDKDGDQASASDNVGSQIVFEDDGPTLTVGPSTQGTGGLAVELDETEGTDRAAPGEVADGNTDDTGPGLGQRTTTVAGGLKALFTVGGSFGSDGPGTLTENLKFIGIPEAGLLTDLEATNGGAITLFANGDTVIEGKDTTDQVVFTISIVEVNPGEFQLVTTLFEAIEHDDDTKFDENVVLTLDDGLVQLQYEVTRTDGDSDAITESAEIDLISAETSYFSFDDDGPRYISPDTLHLENKGVIGTTDQVTANLNFVAGSDGVGNVVFNVPGVAAGVVPPALGLLAEDSAGNDLKVGGQQLYLYYGGVGGTDTTILVAKTLAGVVGFTIDIDPVTGTYIFNQEAPISNGTEVTATDLSGLGGGNVPFKLLIDVGGTTQDVALTTVNTATVNTDKDDIGISQGQTFETGEVVRFDLVNGLTFNDGQGNNDTYSYNNTHNTTNRWKQLIQITGNPGDRADIKVTAILSGNGNDLFAGVGDTVRNLNPANIRIYDQNGSLIDPVNYIGLGISVVDDGDSVNIFGLRDDWSYEIVTNGVAEAFSAIRVAALAGTEDFSLGFFSYGENSAGTSIDLSYPVDATDGDGDKTSGAIDLSLYPDPTSSSGTSFAGTAGNDTFLGTQGVDTISGLGGKDLLAGNAGIDTINGGAGNDTIIAGSGNDILDGGADSDTFVFETLVDGNDSISNFDIAAPLAGGDVLDVSQLLNHSGNTWADGDTVADAVTDGYLTFTNVGGFVQVNVDIDGSAGSGYAPTAVAVLTTVAFGAPATDLNDNIKVD